MDLRDKAKAALRKVDEHLHEKLRRAEASELVRAIVRLRPEGLGAATEPPPLDPADFPDRIAYRKAMIEQRARKLEADVGGVKRKLEAMGLTVKGGQTSPTVVVEGEAGKVLDSLDLEGVEGASLDRQVEMERGRKS